MEFPTYNVPLNTPVMTDRGLAMRKSHKTITAGGGTLTNHAAGWYTGEQDPPYTVPLPVKPSWWTWPAGEMVAPMPGKELRELMLHSQAQSAHLGGVLMEFQQWPEVEGRDYLYTSPVGGGRVHIFKQSDPRTFCGRDYTGWWISPIEPMFLSVMIDAPIENGCLTCAKVARG